MNSINYPATLKRGSKGSGVKWLQSLLVREGESISIDGDFGGLTCAAVKSLQSKHNLVTDGEVGPKTWGVLLPSVVSYKQMDSAWGAKLFTITGDKTQTIASSGCGPACTAMIAATWGFPAVTPVQTCEEAVKGGFRTANSGTAHGYFPAFAKQYGFKCRETQDAAAVKMALEKGALVVGNMGPGQFTKGGHFVLLWTYDRFSNIFYVLDPGSSQAARTKADAARLAREAKKYFIFER